MPKHKVLSKPEDFHHVSMVHLDHIEGNAPIYRFYCDCGELLFISGADTGDPVECENCGITWDIDITAVGERQKVTEGE